MSKESRLGDVSQNFPFSFLSYCQRFVSIWDSFPDSLTNLHGCGEEDKHQVHQVLCKWRKIKALALGEDRAGREGERKQTYLGRIEMELVWQILIMNGCNFSMQCSFIQQVFIVLYFPKNDSADRKGVDCNGDNDIGYYLLNAYCGANTRCYICMLI